MLKLTQWALKLQSNVESSLDKISGKADGASRKFSELQNKISGVESRAGGMAKNIGALFGGLVAGASIGLLAQQSLKAFDEQEKANAQIQAAIKSTGGIAGRTFADLDKQASALQKKTLFADDQTMGAQSLMLTFTKVRGEIYDKAIPAVLDYATALKTDPQQAALQLGKALNDPIQGISTLRRAGVQFSDSQQAMIKNFVATNQLAKAQEVILGELNTQFGGSAEAAAKAGLGPLKMMQNAMGDVMEKLGAVIARVFLRALPYIEAFINGLDKMVNWVGRNLPTIEAVFKSVAIAIGIVGTYLLIVNAKVLLLSASIWLLNTAMAMNPAVAMAVAMVAIVAALVYAWNHFEKFRANLMGFWEGFKAVFTNMGKLVGDIFGGIGEMITGIMDPFNNVDKIKSGYEKLKGAVSNYSEKIGAAAQTGYNKGAAQVKANNMAGESATALSGNSAGLFEKPSQSTEELYSDIKSGSSGVSEGTKQIRNVTVNINKLVETIENHFETLNGMSQNQIQKAVEEALVRAVAGSEQAMSNG